MGSPQLFALELAVVIYIAGAVVVGEGTEMRNPLAKY